MSALRYERKYLFPPSADGQLSAWIRQLPVHFSTAHPNRWVNSIYFDTPDVATLQANLAGAQSRHKYRLRWYGDLLPVIENAVFEVKQKQGFAGKKVLFPVPKVDFQAPQDFLQALYRQLPSIQGLRPVLMVRYERAYYLSSDKKIRLTKDQFVSFRKMGHSDWQQSLDRKPVLLPDNVLEIKYDVQDESRLQSWIQHFPFPLQRNSKYARGMEMVF